LNQTVHEEVQVALAVIYIYGTDEQTGDMHAYKIVEKFVEQVADSDQMGQDPRSLDVISKRIHGRYAHGLSYKYKKVTALGVVFNRIFLGFALHCDQEVILNKAFWGLSFIG